jgi:hypothetical protein
MKELGKQKDAKKARKPTPLYPNATRQSPEAKAKGKNLKALQELQGLYEKQTTPRDREGRSDRATRRAESYEKSFSYQLAGASASELATTRRPPTTSRRPSTRTAWTTTATTRRCTTCVVTVLDGKNDEALATLDQFLAKPSPTSRIPAVRAALARQHRPQRRSGEDLPKTACEEPERQEGADERRRARTRPPATTQGQALLEDATTRACSPSEGTARAVRRLHERRALQGCAEGDRGRRGEGHPQGGPDLAKDYMLLARTPTTTAATATRSLSTARPLRWRRTARPYLNMAKILRDQGKTAEAKAAAQKALDKGVKNPTEPRKSSRLRTITSRGIGIGARPRIGISLEIPAAASRSVRRPALQSGA